MHTRSFIVVALVAASSIQACGGGQGANGADDGGSSGNDAGTTPADTGVRESGPGPHDSGPPPVGQWVNVSPPGVSLDFNNPSSNYGTQAIGVDGVGSGTVYVGTCYQGIWKSTDSGNTWSKVSTGTNGDQIETGRNWTLAVDPTDVNIVYTTPGFGDQQGLYKSTNGGVDWVRIFPAGSTTNVNLDPSGTMPVPTPDVYSVQIEPTNHLHLLISFHSPWNQTDSPGIFESKDGGNTWIEHPAGADWGQGDYAMFLDSPSTWLMATQGLGFWRTTDSGATWKQVSDVSMQHGATQLYRSSAGDLYVGAASTLLRSTDDGLTWTSVGPNNADGYNAIIGDGDWMYAQSANTGTATVGVGSYFISAENDGVTWKKQNSQTFADGPMSMAYDKVGNYVFSSNWDTGVWRLKVR